MYISHIKGVNKEGVERQKALMTWLGMECGCARCVEEKGEEENTVENSMEENNVNENGATT